MRNRFFSAWMVLLACGAAAHASVPATAEAAERRLPESRAEMQLSFAPLVKRVAPAVVNIYSRRVVREARVSPLFDDPFFRQFFGDRLPFGRPRERLEGSLGSGVIVSPDGLIVTNHHVIAKAQEITVALTDRREYSAELVLADKQTDLAVLRIDNGGAALPHLELANSDRLQVGDLVLAVGNPFNVGQTVTSGIVSALARSGVGAGEYQFFIQTDAAINPGNSGGALVAMDGGLVGINTAIFSRSGGSHGIGFAIPSNMVRVVVQSAKKGARTVQRPWLGAATQPVTPDMAVALDLQRPHGALVRDLYPASAAARAGLRPGDVIVGVDGHPVDDPAALTFRIGARLIGDEAVITVLRDGRETELALPLEPAPEEPPRNITLLTGDHALAGARVANLSPAFAEELGLDPFERGVIVLEVQPGSPASRLRLQPKDRIAQLDGESVEEVGALQRLLARRGREWRLAIERGERRLQTVIRE